MKNIVKYLITAIVQGILVGTVQYIFEEVDSVIGATLMLTPLTLINSASITDKNINNYLLSYLNSSFFSLTMGFLYYFLLTKTNMTRKEVYTIILAIIFIVVSAFIASKKTKR